MRWIEGDTLNYKMTENKERTDLISYQVYEKEKLAAEFSYVIESVHDENGGGVMDSLKRFWIRGVRLVNPFEDYQTFDAIIHFIQYKCRVAGYTEMYVRLSARNLFYMELYRRYGFYIIANEEKKQTIGDFARDYVLKYALPDTKEEMYHSYICRSRR